MSGFHSSVDRTGIAFLIVAGLAAGCAHDDSTRNGPSATGVTSAAPTSTGDVPGAASSDRAPSLLVLEANRGAATPLGDPGTYELTFSGVGGVTWFADRPQRRAGDESLARFEEAWPSRFADSQPNAALTIGQGDDAEVAIVTLADAHVEADTVRFRATVVEPEQAPRSFEDHVAARPASELPTTFQGATLFVDPSGEQLPRAEIEVEIEGTRHFRLHLDFDESIWVVGAVYASIENFADLPRIDRTQHGLTIEGELDSPDRPVTIRTDVILSGGARTGRVSGQFDDGAEVYVWGPADGAGVREGAGGGTPPFSISIPLP